MPFSLHPAMPASSARLVMIYAARRLTLAGEIAWKYSAIRKPFDPAPTMSASLEDPVSISRIVQMRSVVISLVWPVSPQGTV
jgi:hypothetical protein